MHPLSALVHKDPVGILGYDYVRVLGGLWSLRSWPRRFLPPPHFTIRRPTNGATQLVLKQGFGGRAVHRIGLNRPSKKVGIDFCIDLLK